MGSKKTRLLKSRPEWYYKVRKLVKSIGNSGKVDGILEWSYMSHLETWDEVHDFMMRQVCICCRTLRRKEVKIGPLETVN